MRSSASFAAGSDGGREGQGFGNEAVLFADAFEDGAFRQYFPDFNGACKIEVGRSLGDLNGSFQCINRQDGVSADGFFGFDERSIRDAAAGDGNSRSRQGLPAADFSGLDQVLGPVRVTIHQGLEFFGWNSIVPTVTPEEEDELSGRGGWCGSAGLHM